MQLTVNYEPSPKQRLIHQDQHRFKIVAAGRRFGKTTLAINELLRQALSHPSVQGRPPQRSWYICDTYRHAYMIAWHLFLSYCPKEIIESKNIQDLMITLTNGHIVEFKGSEDPDKLRGVSLVFVVLDEYGQMSPNVWWDVIRPSLMDQRGTAMFIGTPSADGSPHFHDMYKLGMTGDPNYKSWLCFTTDNPLPEIQRDAGEAKRELPEDIYKREFEADFDVSNDLIYDNFKLPSHTCPTYEPMPEDFVVGSIDPGLQNATAALLTAWKPNTVKGVVFREYYKKGQLATDAAMGIKEMSQDCKVAYWIIDRASIKREQSSGITVFKKFEEIIKPLRCANNDPGTVWAGIDEVKKLFHKDEKTGEPKLKISTRCEKTLWEIQRYTRYKHRWHVDKNEEERPRKLNDHAMDAMRNMVYSQPWRMGGVKIYRPKGNPYGY